MTGIGKSDVEPQTRVGQQWAPQCFILIGSVCYLTQSSSARCFAAARTKRVYLNIDNPFFAFFCVHLCRNLFCTSLMRSSCQLWVAVMLEPQGLEQSMFLIQHVYIIEDGTDMFAVVTRGSQDKNTPGYQHCKSEKKRTWSIWFQWSSLRFYGYHNMFYGSDSWIILSFKLICRASTGVGRRSKELSAVLSAFVGLHNTGLIWHSLGAPAALELNIDKKELLVGGMTISWQNWCFSGSSAWTTSSF